MVTLCGLWQYQTQVFACEHAPDACQNLALPLRAEQCQGHDSDTVRTAVSVRTGVEYHFVENQARRGLLEPIQMSGIGRTDSGGDLDLNGQHPVVWPLDDDIHFVVAPARA